MRAFGELKPISFRSKRMSLSSGVRLDALFELFPFPGRFKFMFTVCSELGFYLRVKS